jgi:hypothetical protein
LMRHWKKSKRSSTQEKAAHKNMYCLFPCQSVFLCHGKQILPS